jgi:hypothetical protein
MHRTVRRWRRRPHRRFFIDRVRCGIERAGAPNWFTRVARQAEESVGKRSSTNLPPVPLVGSGAGDETRCRGNLQRAGSCVDCDSGNALPSHFFASITWEAGRPTPGRNRKVNAHPQLVSAVTSRPNRAAGTRNFVFAAAQAPATVQT